MLNTTKRIKSNHGNTNLNEMNDDSLSMTKKKTNQCFRLEHLKNIARDYADTRF